MKTWGIVGGALVGVVMLVVAFYALRYATADERGAVNAQEQIQGGSARIAAYNSFFDLCASVQGDEARIRALGTEMQTGPSAERVEQINATVTAIRGSRASKVARYNADARKDYTVGQFRSSGLPFALDINGEDTSCTL